MNRIVLGILAHVDAGKTTLSESILYTSGSIRKLGRVDNQDAFLDNNQIERERGITIFSKQAVFQLGDSKVTLLDTPGHVDFSAEMERTLQVLDYAVLVINGADGVQAHTKTLWRLLYRYQIPTFLFVNKMDQSGTEQDRLMQELKQKLDADCIAFTVQDGANRDEEIAVCDEHALEQYLETGSVKQTDIAGMIQQRKLFPCYFGSALKVEGVKELLEGLEEYMKVPEYGTSFGAKVFKIARDAQGNRLTFLKVTSGSLSVKSVLSGGSSEADWTEKVNQIRIYSGEKYETVKESFAGDICAVTGLSMTHPGEGIGCGTSSEQPILEPVLTYQVCLPAECPPGTLLPKLRQLEEEEPELHIVWNEDTKEILVQMMGEVQIEILQRMIKERFGVLAEFGTGRIVYKETVANTVEGVGHFEPLRHYAEVHLRLEPSEPGSGLSLASDCPEDMLDKNWQRQVLTHLAEREHKGVLTGAAITDMCVTLVAGKAHQKHTEGGDFRQASCRALRQGLMRAESVLLEPVYAFSIEVQEELAGRVMHDIERMHGEFLTPQNEQGIVTIAGSAPAACMQDYQRELTAFSGGRGRITCTLKGYEPCHNADEVIAAFGYDVQRDTQNTPDSVFCAHGAGYIVPWNEVEEHMHLAYVTECKEEEGEVYSHIHAGENAPAVENWIGTEEIDAIIEKTTGANRRGQARPANGAVRRHTPRSVNTAGSPVTRTYHAKKDSYLLVDGYNVIFAWQELKELAAVSLDGARGKLMDILCNYQGIRGGELIVVFDAYRIEGHKTELFDYHNIHVVYTKEAETADQYIEHFAHENAGKYEVTAATSDGLEQMIIRGAGCRLISSRELEKEIAAANERMHVQYEQEKDTARAYMLDDKEISIDET